MPVVNFKIAGRVFLGEEEMVQVYVGDQLIWEKIGFVDVGAPSITSLTISGSGLLDSVHTANLAYDEGSPAADVSYQWTKNGQPVQSESAVSDTYIPTVEDGFVPGDILGLSVRVENVAGFDNRLSNNITVTGVAPTIVSTPVITGSGVINTLHVVNVDTTPGTPAADPTYQWKKNGSNIPNATDVEYRPTVDDGFANGDDLTVTVSIENVAGSDSETSAAKEISGVPTFIDPVIGGDVVAESASYWWHVFTTNGEAILTANANITSLVVSGGGAGGKGNLGGQPVNIAGGGGGGGGYIVTNNEAMTTGTYEVVIGAGGNPFISTGVI